MFYGLTSLLPLVLISFNLAGSYGVLGGSDIILVSLFLGSATITLLAGIRVLTMATPLDSSDRPWCVLGTALGIFSILLSLGILVRFSV